ncbi:glycosyltransferase [Aestuariibius sp. 2305UL40-4]|uniref:glycosyltransferase n=1 Tax=Aestuariibius violaceus TaxID=3234132 RepID=UPI00345ED8FE
MTHPPLLGICRFSFLGRCDWRIWGAKDRSEAEIRAELARTLYQPTRMEPRFWTFEHLLLNSLKAQTDPNFAFLVLTSPDLPAPMCARLQDLCAPLPQVDLLISDAESVSDAIRPHISHLEEIYGERPVQFRIDDDDCLSPDYIERLRHMMNRMAGLQPITYSRARGLVLSLYEGEPVGYYDLNRPYHSAGAALRPPRGKTIFDFGHFRLQRRFTGITDLKGFGSLALKYDGHDASRIDPDEGKPGHTRIDAKAFTQIMDEHFPFLAQVDFNDLRGLLAP